MSSISAMETSEVQPEPVTAEAERPEDDQVSPRAEAASGSDNPNPFWSDRAIEEFRIRQARPLGLAEYDEEQREPEYFGSETGRSMGFASATGLSARASSPLPARGSETSSDSRRSNAMSNAPSMTSRSRSIRELLVSLGSAVPGLAEEQRQTRQRLSVVEEIRSGSTSSMRTGREGGEPDSGNVAIEDLGVGPQMFQIGDTDLDEPRDLGSGLFALEDWVQAPMRLEDIPREMTLVGPVGVPESFHPSNREIPAQVPGISSANREVLAQVPGKGYANREVRAQVPGIGSANREVRAQVPGIGSANREVHAQVPGLGSANREVHAQVPGIGSANREVRAHVPGIGSANREVHAQVPGIGSANREVHAQVPGIGSAYLEASAQVSGRGSA